MTRGLRLATVLSLGVLASASSAFAQQATIEALGPVDAIGDLQGWDVTDDGVVVGDGRSADGYTAFRWNQAGVGTDVSSALGIWGRGTGISDDGSVVGGSVGDLVVVFLQHFRWTAAGGPQLLPPDPNGWRTAGAEGISGDGNFLVGSSLHDVGVDQLLQHATRWSASNGHEDLDGRSTFGLTSLAYAASFDGSVIVGEMAATGSGRHAFRWTSLNGMQDLGSIAGGWGRSFAYGVSADGSVVVGGSEAPDGNYHAFRWTSLNGMQDLAQDTTLYSSYANDVSADGRVIVGTRNNEAAIWIDGQFRPLFQLLTELGVDLTGWDSSYSVANGCSPDGRFITGQATFDGARAFRVRLRTGNAAPTLLTPETKRIECAGGITSVTLSTVVNDADPLDRLSVVWRVDGVIRRSTPGLISGAADDFTDDYSDGTHLVTVEASDGVSTTRKETTVTIVDTTAPIIVVAPTLTLSVDREMNFASSSRIPQPTVRDLCDDDPAVFLNAPARLPIGMTTVTWTVKDLSGNVAKATQRIKVTNLAPIANAGPLVRKTTKSASAKATLDGSKSKDPDGQPLKFLWKAKGIRFVNASVATPTGTFPLGRTVVTLTVTDPAGLKSTDTTTVVVSRARRPSAVAADAYAHAAKAQAMNAVRSFDSDAARGLSLAAYAEALGAVAGDEVLGSGISRDDYAQLRHRQSEISAAAVEAFARSFASTGNQAALEAGVYALSSSAYARNDLDR